MSRFCLFINVFHSTFCVFFFFRDAGAGDRAVGDNAEAGDGDKTGINDGAAGDGGTGAAGDRRTGAAGDKAVGAKDVASEVSGKSVTVPGRMTLCGCLAGGWRSRISDGGGFAFSVSDKRQVIFCACFCTLINSSFSFLTISHLFCSGLKK